MCFRKAVLLALLLLSGCSEMLAEQIVKAPNQNPPTAASHDPTSQELRHLYVDRQLKIPVGPPNATIAVWVFNPFRGHETFRFVGSGRQIRADVHRASATQPVEPKATIFILHGIQDQMDLGPYVLYREMLVHQGYRVVQLDFRGHGRSTGDWITYGAVESHDLVQVLDELEKQNLIAGNVGVVGVSYGGAIAIEWAGIDPRVKAIVAVEPFTSLQQVAHDGAGFVLGAGRFLFTDDDIRNCVNSAGHLAGFNPDDANPLRAITQTRAPILLIHSRSDEFIPWQHSQRLHDAAPDHSKLILVDGASHFDLWLKSFDLIQKATLQWFEKNLLAADMSKANNAG